MNRCSLVFAVASSFCLAAPNLFEASAASGVLKLAKRPMLA